MVLHMANILLKVMVNLHLIKAMDIPKDIHRASLAVINNNLKVIILLQVVLLLSNSAVINSNLPLLPLTTRTPILLQLQASTVPLLVLHLSSTALLHHNLMRILRLPRHHWVMALRRIFNGTVIRMRMLCERQ